MAKVQCIRADHYRAARIPCKSDATMVKVVKISGTITMPLCSDHIRAYRASGITVKQEG